MVLFVGVAQCSIDLQRCQQDVDVAALFQPLYLLSLVKESVTRSDAVVLVLVLGAAALWAACFRRAEPVPC